MARLLWACGGCDAVIATDEDDERPDRECPACGSVRNDWTRLRLYG